MKFKKNTTSNNNNNDTNNNTNSLSAAATPTLGVKEVLPHHILSAQFSSPAYILFSIIYFSRLHLIFASPSYVLCSLLLFMWPPDVATGLVATALQQLVSAEVSQDQGARPGHDVKLSPAAATAQVSPDAVPQPGAALLVSEEVSQDRGNMDPSN